MISVEKWFPDVPAGWGVSRLGNCFEQVRQSVNEELGIVTVFRDGQVTLRSNRRSDGYTEATDYSLYQVIRPGQLGIHTMDAFAGAVGVSDSLGMCSPVVTVCDPKPHVNAKYFAWVLREMARSGWIEANAKSVRERTSEFRWPMAKAQLVPLPPRVEQDAIVDFLDKELEKLDALTSKAQELSKLILERKPSVVKSHMKAFEGKTKRDKLSRLVNAKKGPRADKLSKETLNQEGVGYPVYSGQTGAEGITGWDSSFDFDFPQGVVLATTVGANAMSVRLISGKFSLSQNCMIIWSDFISAKFLEIALSDLFPEVRDRMSTHMQPSFRMSDLESLWLEFPDSVSETEQLQKEIEFDLNKMELLYAKSNSLIETLNLKRVALIQEAVTGQINLGGR